MVEWLDGLAGPAYTQAILWTFGALILLLIVLVIVKLVRSLTFGTFVAGGRNRKTRLAVMDATAVDSHRRLILVRRDDVEHLLLIGGPTDVVVERDIRLGQQRRPALTADAGREAQAPRPRAAEPASARPSTPQPQPRAPERAPVQSPQRAAVEPALAPRLPPLPSYANAPRPEPTRMPLAAHGLPPHHESRPSPAPRPYSPVPAPQRDDLDDALLKELEVSLENGPARQETKTPAASLDDEMTKLLGELSSHKR